MRSPLLMLLVGACLFVRGTEGEAWGSGAAQATPSDRWTIDFKLGLAEKLGRWVFAVDGSTNLPAETLLRVRVTVVDLVDDPIGGPREDDDEALVRDDDEGQPRAPRFAAAAGGFHQEVYAFSRKPYSIRYRAKIRYLPEDQTAQVRLRVGDDEFERKADLRVGSDDEYEKELKERARELARDLAALEKIGGALGAAASASERASWEKVREEARAQIEALSERNLERYNLWAVWLEGRSRMYVGALCELLRRIMVAVEAGFAGDAGSQKRAEDLLRGFRESVDQAYDRTGIDGPLDPRRVGPIVAAYERGLAPFRSWLGTAAGDGARIRRKARHDGLVALFELPALLENRRRGYLFVNALGAQLIRLLELAEAGAAPELLQKALGDHDLALSEFKRFAGLE